MPAQTVLARLGKMPYDFFDGRRQVDNQRVAVDPAAIVGIAVSLMHKPQRCQQCCYYFVIFTAFDRIALDIPLHPQDVRIHPQKVHFGVFRQLNQSPQALFAQLGIVIIQARSPGNIIVVNTWRLPLQNHRCAFQLCLLVEADKMRLILLLQLRPQRSFHVMSVGMSADKGVQLHI